MIVTERHTHTPYVGYSTISQATPPSLTLTSRDDATRPASVRIPEPKEAPRPIQRPTEQTRPGQAITEPVVQASKESCADDFGK